MTERERDQRDLEIISKVMRGESHRNLAKQFGVSPNYVFRLMQAWRDAA